MAMTLQAPGWLADAPGGLAAGTAAAAARRGRPTALRACRSSARSATAARSSSGLIKNLRLIYTAPCHKVGDGRRARALAAEDATARRGGVHGARPGGAALPRVGWGQRCRGRRRRRAFHRAGGGRCDAVGGVSSPAPLTTHTTFTPHPHKFTSHTLEFQSIPRRCRPRPRPAAGPPQRSRRGGPRPAPRRPGCRGPRFPGTRRAPRSAPDPRSRPRSTTTSRRRSRAQVPGAAPCTRGFLAPEGFS